MASGGRDEPVADPSDVEDVNALAGTVGWTRRKRRRKSVGSLIVAGLLRSGAAGRLVALASRAGVDVEIGDPRRTYTVEPLEDPVPREVPSEPPREPSEEPTEPEKVAAD